VPGSAIPFPSPCGLQGARVRGGRSRGLLPWKLNVWVGALQGRAGSRQEDERWVLALEKG